MTVNRLCGFCSWKCSYLTFHRTLMHPIGLGSLIAFAALFDSTGYRRFVSESAGFDLKWCSKKAPFQVDPLWYS
jgi:hypothetical protein